MQVNTQRIEFSRTLWFMTKARHERLREARESAGFKTGTDAAKFLGVATQTYLAHENGNRDVPTDAGERYAARFKVDFAWLMTGRGEMRGKSAPGAPLHFEAATIVQVEGDTYARLPVFDIRAQAGKGALAYDGEPIGWRLFDYSWIKSVSRAPIDQLKVVEVAGDSMEPTLYKGDHVLIDLGDVALARHGLFVLRLDDSLIVKRVQKTFKTGAVRIISDNPKYDTEEIEDPDRLSVVGRVIWLGRSLG